MELLPRLRPAPQTKQPIGLRGVLGRRRARQHNVAPRLRSETAALAPGAAALLAYIPNACFDATCQAEVDRVFSIAIGVPIVVAVVSVAWLLRPLPKDAKERVFEDPATGAVFERPEGLSPERDRNNELAFRVLSYTPWPVEEGAAGERIRIDVGPTNGRQPRTFVFDPLIRSGRSRLLTVTLPRPLGIVFEEDAARRRVVVDGFVPGGNAEQQSRVAEISPSAARRAAAEGDILRAATCTNIVYPTQSLFGAQPPQRHIVVYGADGQKWPDVMSALKKGMVQDGEVTLVLERPL